MNNDETATQTQLYRCPRCGQPLGPPTEDGRIEITLANGETWYLIGARLDCACGMRQTLGPDVRVGPAFVEKWYPDGKQEGEEDEGQS